MKDETDPYEKYAKTNQMNFFQGVYRNKFKEQLAHKKKIHIECSE
jgi:hypothetical protein